MFWKEIVGVCEHELFDSFKYLLMLSLSQLIKATVTNTRVLKDPLFVGDLDEAFDELLPPFSGGRHSHDSSRTGFITRSQSMEIRP